jgi:predicted RNase H-like HicB family nuclease
MNIKVIVEPGEDGYFVAHVSSLKSCWSQGKTKEEPIQNIREAIDLYLEPEPKELAVPSAEGERCDSLGQRPRIDARQPNEL